MVGKGSLNGLTRSCFQAKEGIVNHSWRKPLFVAALAGASLLVVTPASATTPVGFTGSFQDTSSAVTAFRQADGNTFISQTVSVLYAGDLAGTVVEHIELIIHPDGTLNFMGADVCTCTLAGTGLSGTIVLPFTGTGAGGGQFTIGEGTGGLANMHGVGTFTSSNGGVSGPFSGIYHFDH
jgi:hypothetical protein